MIIKRINEIINDILDAEIYINKDTLFNDIPELDSMSRTLFFVTVENEFNVELDIPIVSELETVGAFCELLKNR